MQVTTTVYKKEIKFLQCISFFESLTESSSQTSRNKKHFVLPKEACCWDLQTYVTFAKTLISGPAGSSATWEGTCWGTKSNIDQGLLSNKTSFIFLNIFCLDDYDILNKFCKCLFADNKMSLFATSGVFHHCVGQTWCKTFPLLHHLSSSLCYHMWKFHFSVWILQNSLTWLDLGSITGSFHLVVVKHLKSSKSVLQVFIATSH